MTNERFVEEENLTTGNHVNSTQSLKRKIRNLRFAVVCLILCCIMMLGNVRLEHQISTQQEKEVCLMAVVVDLLEDRLFLLYGKFPEELGFGELRDAWIDDPCKETLEPYYNALEDFFKDIEGNEGTPLIPGEMIKT